VVKRRVFAEMVKNFLAVPAQFSVVTDQLIVSPTPALHQNYKRLQDVVICSEATYHFLYPTPTFCAKPPFIYFPTLCASMRDYGSGNPDGGQAATAEHAADRGGALHHGGVPGR
jgi:hypothetical protein